MANGYHGSREGWDRITEPLLGLDPILAAFAEDRGLVLGKNTHNWPDRTFRWEDSLERLIQIYLADQSTLTWHLWICASEDRSDGWRYSKREHLAYGVTAQELELDLSRLLADAWKRVTAWKTADLERAVHLRR